jgi:hypothetical protein
MEIAPMKYRVWYIPQVPGKRFEVLCDVLVEAQKTLDLLQGFSLFEYENKIKPDYADAGGIEVWNEADQEWEEVEDE